MSPRAHSKLGASKAERWINCPGSVALCETLPEPPESPAAREGTNAHAWAEFALTNGEVSISDYVGAECPSAELAEFPPLTTDMADAVNVYLEHVWSLLSAEDELHVERSFSLEFIAPGMFGTNDCCILKPGGTLHVIDYKHGAGVYVTEKDNPQLKYYALGALETFRATHKVSRVVTTIVQPRYTGGAADPVRSHEYDALEIWEFGLALQLAADEARKPDAPLSAGSWCKFCPGTKAGRCPKFKSEALSVAANGLVEIIPPGAVAPVLANEDPREIGERYKKIPLLEKFIEEFREYARAETLAGKATGLKFVPPRGTRAWAKPDVEVMTEIYERTGQGIRRTEAMSPAQVEKLLGKKAFAGLDDLVTKKYSKPSLVHESDKRPAMSLQDVLNAGADGLEAIEHPE